MKSVITRYKKTAALVAFVAAISMSSVISAGCGACAAAAAIRQSIKDAQAAALNSGKKSLEDELDDIDMDEEEAVDRAAREELFDPCSPCKTCSCEGGCSLNCKLQTLFNCCVDTNKQVRCQGHEARKCCKRLNHKLNDIEDQVSVVDNVVVSQSDAAAACCSVTSAQITALSASVADVFALLTQVFNCTCP